MSRKRNPDPKGMRNWASVTEGQEIAWEEALEKQHNRELTVEEKRHLQRRWIEYIETMIEGRSPGRYQSGKKEGEDKPPPKDVRLQFNGHHFWSKSRPRQTGERQASIEEVLDKWTAAARDALRSHGGADSCPLCGSGH